jgi:hypothetical protein
MPSNKFKTAKFTWGAAFANTLNIGYPLDNVSAGDEPRAGSMFEQAPSGVEDSWITGRDYKLTFDVRWIPQVDVASPVATGWDTGTVGFAEFLYWVRQKNQCRFFPDAASGTYILSYLSDPMQGTPPPETDGSRKMTMTLRNSTTPYNGY